MENELYHYGTKFHSGRYPYGSGEEPFQHDANFYETVKKLRKQGMSEDEIAEGFGITKSQLKAHFSLAKDEFKTDQYAKIRSYKEEGMSNIAIAEKLGITEGTVRNYLNPVTELKLDKTISTADSLKRMLDDKGVIDIGSGVELEVGVSKERLKTATEMLKAQGYNVYNIPIEQMGTGHTTTVKVIAKEDISRKDIMEDKTLIKSWTEYSSDNGKTWANIEPPSNFDSSRLMVRYKEDGGDQKDGVIELRRGVDDISLGDSQYAQVRIAVDGTHYLKGMAMYSDNMPDGVDIIFNTNKHVGTPALGDKDNTVLKPLKKDPDNPFGATIKPDGQRHYIDANGEDKLSPVNKIREESEWGEWAKVLPSQFLSKQNYPLIKRQLDLTYADKEIEYREILAYTNPAVRKKLLESFADECDAMAVNLKATSLPRQGAHVILPISSMKDNEIYAPNYENGEHVVLIRYPHGGTFEIPELVVNNKQAEARSVMGNAADAVGINSKVAARLSGADFDGDTVMVIPVNSRVRVKTSPPLKALEGFDPTEEYGPTSTTKKYKIMKDGQQKQTEMGKISNLITDMTLMGADESDIAKAVKHSMVVIDAPKHQLDYQRSYIENDIATLKERYQGGKDKGAATLISRAKGQARVDERTGTTYIDAETGKKIYKESGRVYSKPLKDKDGNYKYDEDGNLLRSEPKKAQTKITKMAKVDDAYELLSDNPNKKEIAYADFANKMKAMGNAARKELKNSPNLEYSPSAAKTYADEVNTLNSKLNKALKNAPKERQAQVMANAIMDDIKRSNPDMDNDTTKKKKNQTLAACRSKYGSKKSDVMVEITDKEWEAIQAGAVSHSKVIQILNNTDMTAIKERATPRTTSSVTEGKQMRIKAMAASGNYTIKEIAQQLGLSTSTVSKYMKS